MSYNIICPFMLEYTVDHVQLSQNGTVWPCCKYSQAFEDFTSSHDQQSSDAKTLASDVILQAEFDKDKHWNDLKYHELDDILENDIFKKYIATDGWNSDNPPLLCKKHCNNIEK
tara:strand:+ start:604 stop:945 length:342 start_codon:yes stop_codon:yes gene_type:complete